MHVCRHAQDSPYLGDTVLASALAQIYVVKLRYFDKLRSGYKRGFQCFAQQQVRPYPTQSAPRPRRCPPYTDVAAAAGCDKCLQGRVCMHAHIGILSMHAPHVCCTRARPKAPECPVLQARYLIGTDWNRKSYVVGLGKAGYDRTVHRGASCPPAQDADGTKVRCPPDTRGSNRPDVNEITGGVLWLPEVRAPSPHPHTPPLPRCCPDPRP